jgi:predicted cupin superfamily sugar epimerase
MLRPEDYIRHLGLLAHPEGGYYKEVFRSEETLSPEQLPARFGGARQVITSIYFLIKPDFPSHFHRIKSDEIWYFHDGNGLIIHVLHPDGAYEKLALGRDLPSGQRLQACVPAGSWFAAECASNLAPQFSLVSCAVAPGFDFADFELAERLPLQSHYPKHHDLIQRFTRDESNAAL